MTRDRANVEARIDDLLGRGDMTGAATAALEGYGPEIFGYLASVIRDESAVADVFAEFCEDLWRGLRAYRRLSSFRTWAYKIAWNAARMFWRDPYRRRVRRLRTSEAAQLAERLRTSSRRDDGADRLAALRSALSADEQTLLILRLDKALSWKEIAVVLAEDDERAADPAALRKRYERLKARLVRLAKQRGLG